MRAVTTQLTLALLATFVVFCPAVFALDFNPPPWDRADGFAMTADWEFTREDPVIEADGPLTDLIGGSGRPTIADMGPGNVWSGGVWQMNEAPIHIEMDNVVDTLPLKQVWIQFTYEETSAGTPPAVMGIVGPDVTSFRRVSFFDYDPLHRREHWLVTPNPDWEFIDLFVVPGTTTIDRILIDTLSTDFTGEGFSDEDPRLPDPEMVGGDWVFSDVPGDGRWFDPIAATGYEYATDGLSDFTKVGLPFGHGGPSEQYTVTDAVNGTVVVGEGVTHQFPTPVNQFTVTGIDPAVDGEDPSAFPTYLEFSQPSANFTMTPIPEPSTFLLAAAGLLGLVFYGRRRGR